MAEPPDQAAPAPRIKITRLHIEGYRSLRRVRWPEDGLGWDGAVPDTVLVGGLNGSGKTTLLELIFEVVRFVVLGFRSHRNEPLLPGSKQADIWLDISGKELRLGSSPVRPPASASGWDLRLPTSGRHPGPDASREVLEAAVGWISEQFERASSSRLIYFPTDRAVLFPATEFKGPGSRQKRGDSPVYRYQPPSDWKGSVEAIFYDAKWSDLLAISRGKPNPGHFAAFERAMQRFFAGEKQLFWDDEGVLHVKTKDGVLHPLEALSSGEKQVLLFAADLVDRWTPGSLILIDEPELHLHEAWLAALWALISELQRERGGQVIVTTQSNYLWGLGGLGTHVLLGGWTP